MTTIDLTTTPNLVSVSAASNTALFPSPLIASAQTLDRGGQKWRTILTYTNLRLADRGDLLGIIMALRGQANRLRVPVFDNPKRGAYGGTPLVNGASQTGSTLNIDGCSNNITHWIRRGDYFSVTVNGEQELHMCTADDDSNGSGQIAGLAFEPRLRASPLNNAVIRVEDGSLPVPAGVYVLENQIQGWTSKPGKGSQLSDISLALLEDVFATQ